MKAQEKTFQLNKLSGNQLKILALVAMTCDHVGKELLPEYRFLQIIGRLAFPIFAYMIAEGCVYTKNRRDYLLRIAGLAVLCQVAYFVAERSWFQCILVTFSLAICMIYILDYARRQQTIRGWILAATVCAVIYFVSDLLPFLLSGTDYGIDYGIWGILLPVCVYFAPSKWKVPVTAAMLFLLSVTLGGDQWYSFGAVILLALYSGKRGNANIKNLFFIYYPVHLAIIYLMSLWVD